MISGLLFTIFIILLLGFIAGAIVFGVLHSKNKEYYTECKDGIREKYQKEFNDYVRYGHHTDEECKKKEKELNAKIKAEQDAITVKNYKKPFIGFLAAALAMFALVITVPGSFHQVNAGTYAVVKEVGKITDVKTPGTYYDFYMTKSYQIYDATVQQVKINTAAYSKDGQTMDLEIYLQYQIQLDKLVIRDNSGVIIQTEGIAGKYGNLESLQARIETQCIEKTKAVMSKANAMTIIENRASYSEQVSETVREAIGPDYYVNVQDVVLTNIDFTDEFERSVEAKVVAAQDKEAAETKAKAEAEVARIKAENEKLVAEIEAEKKRIEAEADAEVVRIAAEAQAKATVEKIIELARTVGFTVNETATGYEIVFDAIHTQDMFKELVQEYLEYLAYLDKWNGDLPDVVTDDSGVIINVPDNITNP